MTHQEPNVETEWERDSKWMKLIFAAAPPGWVGIVWDVDRPKIVATGDDEESTRLAARTSGYANAVLIHVPAQPSAGKASKYSVTPPG